MIKIKIPPDKRSPLVGALAGVIVGATFGLIGFVLATQPASRDLGLVLFLFVPLAAGIAIVFTMRGKGSLATVGLVSATLSLFCLVAMGKEGLLCALMAFPLLFVALLIGVGIGLLLYNALGSTPSRNSTMLILLPVLIAGGHAVELKTAKPPRPAMVTTSIWLPAAPEAVWTQVERVDAIGGPRPFLMYVGLPIPQRCEISGSKRTCYFDKGYIEESILDWQPPLHMRLSIDRTNLPGRHWLGFENAEYTLLPDRGGTLLTRTTTITSGLAPQWYWEPLERWGVSSEHHYLFQDLQRKLSTR